MKKDNVLLNNPTPVYYSTYVRVSIPERLEAPRRSPDYYALPICPAMPYLATPYALLSTSYALLGLAMPYPLYWTVYRLGARRVPTLQS